MGPEGYYIVVELSIDVELPTLRVLPTWLRWITDITCFTDRASLDYRRYVFYQHGCGDSRRITDITPFIQKKHEIGSSGQSKPD